MRTAALTALLADAVDALTAAAARHHTQQEAPAEALSKVTLDRPRTAGLRFEKRDALAGLVVMVLTPDGFKPAR